MTVKDRIKLFIKNKGLSQAKFEKAAGLSNGYVNGIKSAPGADKLQNIFDAFPDLNTSWLLTGEGEMLKEEQSATQPEDEEPRDPVPNDRGHMIPFYDAETTGGYSGIVSSSAESVQLSGYVNAGDWFDGRETAAIRHVGDSMVEYPSGCILAVKEVRNRELLVPGRNYVIETDEYRITKRVQRGSSRNTIALYSTNKETYADGRLIYEPFEVSLEDVRRIFSVLGYIVSQQGETHISRL